MESVVALFSTPQQAARALQVLQSRGFDRDHLAFASANAVTQSEVASATGISPEEGAPEGGAAVIRSAIYGALAGLAMTVPVWLALGAFESTKIYTDGGMYAALFGIIGGLTLGGLFGAISGSDHGDYVRLLRGFGMPGDHAERMYNRMKKGDVLVIARDSDTGRTAEASALMRQLGAVSLDNVDNVGQHPMDEVPLQSEGRADRAAAEAADGVGNVTETPANADPVTHQQVPEHTRR